MLSRTYKKLVSFFKNNLAGKFVLLTVSVVLVLMTVLVVINFQLQRNNIVNNLKTQTEMLGNFVSSITPEVVLSYEFDSLNEYMRQISNARDVAYAVILATNGDALTTYLRKDNPHIKKAILDVEHGDVKTVINEVNKQSNIFHQRFPLVYENVVLGYFEVGIDKSRIEEQIEQEIISQFIIGAIFSVLLGLGVYVVFRHYTLKPILGLARGAQRVTGGDLNYNVEVNSGDELGQLAVLFNKMIHELNTSNAEKDDALTQLQDLNHNLEERVEMRTFELGEANRQLENLAMRDSLTGLPNRNRIQNRLKDDIFKAELNGQKFSVIMMDLDRFKEVNDSMGHECGDKLLIKIANKLKILFRPQDLVGRLGGDEFAIILQNTDVKGATVVAEKIHEMLEATFQIENMSFSIGTSLGIAVYPEHGETVSSLLKSADIAMYHAKHNKLGNSIFDPSKADHGVERLNLLSELRKAILDGGLELFYQPKVDLKSEKITGVEALLRWHHDEHGFIPPDEFIPMAEQSGLIRQLTYWVVSTAMEQCERWQKMGLFIDVAINLSMYNLQDPEFPGQLLHILDKHDIDNSHIVFEITESAIMSNPEYVMSVLEQLGYYDFAFSIDDFGTGYSSLANLKKLPVQELKIDRSFVSDIASDMDDASIVHSIIDMAQNLALKVVAEGVETELVLRQLANLGCDIVQGYFLSRPITVKQVTELLTDKNWSIPSGDDMSNVSDISDAS